jgi:hypothetical protein
MKLESKWTIWNELNLFSHLPNYSCIWILKRKKLFISNYLKNVFRIGTEQLLLKLCCYKESIFFVRSFSICLQLKYMKLWKKFHTCFYKLFCLIKLQILCKAKNKHILALIFKKTKFCVLMFWNLSGSTLPWQIAGHRCYRKRKKRKRKNILASVQLLFDIIHVGNASI